MIVRNLLPEKPSKPLFGLKAKLDELGKKGFVLNQNDVTELL